MRIKKLLFQMKLEGITMFVIVTLLSLYVIITVYPLTSFAHLSKTFGNTTINAGWISEPPLQGDLNGIILQFSRETGTAQTPIANAFENLTVFIKSGTVTKELDFQPSPATDGGYEGVILPTKVGPYSLVLEGDVKGQIVDSEIKIEDVESKSIFSFPDSSVDTTSTNNINQQVQNGISKLSNDFRTIRDDLNKSENQVMDIKQSIDRLQAESSVFYMVLLTTLGISIAAIVMSGYLFTLLRGRK